LTEAGGGSSIMAGGGGPSMTIPSIISGAFGLFNGETGNYLTGYGRNFVYDARMMEGKTPPYFPTLNAFIAFTNDILDKIVWQIGG